MHDEPRAAKQTAAACRLGVWGGITTLVGIVASGPPAFLVVSAIHPQPSWQGAEVFAQHYHPMQALPFFAGFLLVGGYVLQIASLHTLARPEQRARTASALAFTSIFAALVFFNYIVQTMLVPLSRRVKLARSETRIGGAKHSVAGSSQQSESGGNALASATALSEAGAP